MRIALSLAAVAAVTLSGCSTMQTARERLVKAPPRCVDETVEVYFAPDQAELTPESRMVINQAASGAAACKVIGVEVVGLADAAGAPAANLELSKRRAQSVAAALTANGVPTADFKVSGAGQAGATTADGKTAPLRRRTEVTLHLARRR
ncbi:MAG: outer membrane protein [Phenylobacterium sp.]|nr:outer membrane protein [Phenylobacterium sp.]